MRSFIVYNGGVQIDLFNKLIPRTITDAKQKIELNGVDVLYVTCRSAEPIDFKIGCYTTAFGRKYTLNRLPVLKKIQQRLFEYDLEFEGVQYDLLRVTYDLTIDTTNNQLQDIQGDSLTGDLKRFAQVLIANANRVFTGQWEIDEENIPATDTKTLTFGDTDNCLSVLQSLCSESNFNMEFEITQSIGINTIHFSEKIGETLPYTFEFGKGKGIYSLERQNVDSSNIVTRLKVFGSTENISYKYRAARLCLPNCSKGESFIEKSDAVQKYGICEATKYFDDIKPTFDGKITGLVSGSVLKFSDTKMFDLNEKETDGTTTKYLISGVTPKIHFNTGNLAGYEFDIDSYDTQSKTFTLKKQTDENGYEFPSSTSEAFQFGINDTYKIIDVTLPDDYVTDAENRLSVAGNTYYDQNCQPKVQYSLSIAKTYLQQLVGNGSTVNIFEVGDYIHIKDTDLGVDKGIRISSFTRNLLDEYVYDLTISDTVTVSTITRIISDLIDTNKTIDLNNLNNPANARANWRSSREILGMVFDPDGDYYSEKIKPESIDTLLLSVGAKSMQFGLTNTVFEPNYNGNKNLIKVTGGTLTHYTIDETEARVWTLANNETILNNDAQAYYIYAKCERAGNAGTIIFSTEQIKTEQDVNYFHFWIGILNSVDTELQARSISLSYGFTMINGRFIKTGRIESYDGKTYFDLDNSRIGGNISFVDSNGDEQDLGEWVDGTKQNIDNALAVISIITSDNVLSADEKPQQRQEWDKIYKDYNEYNTQAQSFGITTEFNNYSQKFFALAQYLNNGSVWNGGVWSAGATPPSWLTDANLSVNTTIVGSTYRLNWVNYYNAETVLKKAFEAKANNNALNALNQLLALADDNQLSPSDKQLYLKEWETIQSEYGVIRCQADDVGAVTDSFEVAYSNLSSYITPLLANLTTASDLGANGGATLRSKFTDYYTQKAYLQEDITNALNNNFNNLNNTVNNQTAGGKNYIRNGNFGAGTMDWNFNGNCSYHILNPPDGLPNVAASGIKITTTQYGDGVWQNFADAGNRIDLNKDYILSFIAKSDIGNNQLDIGYEQSGMLHTFGLSTSWAKYSWKFKPTDYKNIHFYLLGTGTFSISNIQLEQGTIPSDYKNYPYLEQAFAGSTQYKGGLLLSNVIGAKDAFGQVKSYMSGLAGKGTAFAAGVNNFMTENETKNIDLRHDGTGKIGIFEVNEDGNIIIYDASNLSLIRLLFSKSNIELVSNILSENVYGETVTNQNTMLSSEGSVLLTNCITVTKDKSTLTFIGDLYLDATIIAGFSQGQAAVEIILQKNDSYYSSLGSISAEVNDTNTYFNKTISINSSLLVNSGTYKVLVRLALYGATANGGVGGSSTFAWSYNNDIRRFEFGKDGFMSWYTDNHLHFSENGGLDVRGTTNLPGVLLAGEVGVNGGFVSVWGAKTHASKNGEKTATGQYKVWHSVGYSDYQVQITPTSANRSCYIVSKGIDNFVVYFYSIGSSPALADTGFHFSITGKNYV